MLLRPDWPAPPLRMSYETMAASIKADLEHDLGLTFAVGLAPTKVVAKLASKWQKPAGLTIIRGTDLHLSRPGAD